MGEAILVQFPGKPVIMSVFYQPIRDFLTERYTLLLELGIDCLETPRFYVDVVNQTKDVPLVVHEMRIHYGAKDYCHYLRLPPFESVTISPKARFRFVLGYGPSELIVGQRVLSATPPIDFAEDDSGPSFDSPAGLFNAIGMGKAADSWIEVDFNQYTQRSFKKGKVKDYFDAIGKSIRRHREKSRDRRDGLRVTSSQTGTTELM